MGKGRERGGEAGHKGGRNEGDPDPQILAPAQSLQTGQECPVFSTCRRGNPRRKEEGEGKGGEGLQTHRQKTSIPGAAAASIPSVIAQKSNRNVCGRLQCIRLEMLNVTSNHGRISVERQCTLYNVVDVDSVNTLGLRRDLKYCGSGIWYYGDAAVIMSCCVCIDR